MSEKLPAWIPEDISEALKVAAAPGWQGRVEIHYNDGQAHEVSVTRRVKVKRKGVSLPAAVRCPQCERQMESRDYGNLFVCDACGVKRTRAQIQRGGVAV